MVNCVLLNSLRTCATQVLRPCRNCLVTLHYQRKLKAKEEDILSLVSIARVGQVLLEADGTGQNYLFLVTSCLGFPTSKISLRVFRSITKDPLVNFNQHTFLKDMKKFESFHTPHLEFRNSENS